jgi:predicted  nucleic acid-binding Zn-ribbon protein
VAKLEAAYAEFQKLQHEHAELATQQQQLTARLQQKEQQIAHLEKESHEEIAKLTQALQSEKKESSAFVGGLAKILDT